MVNIEQVLGQAFGLTTVYIIMALLEAACSKQQCHLYVSQYYLPFWSLNIWLIFCLSKSQLVQFEIGQGCFQHASSIATLVDTNMYSASFLEQHNKLFKQGDNSLPNIITELCFSARNVHFLWHYGESYDDFSLQSPKNICFVPLQCE